MSEKNKSAKVTISNIIGAFEVNPNQLWYWESRGFLPKRPRGTVPASYIVALAEHILMVRGSITLDARKMLETVAGDR
jgi:hypothetical protein